MLRFAAGERISIEGNSSRPKLRMDLKNRAIRTDSKRLMPLYSESWTQILRVIECSYSHELLLVTCSRRGWILVARAAVAASTAVKGVSRFRSSLRIVLATAAALILSSRSEHDNIHVLLKSILYPITTTENSSHGGTPCRSLIPTCCFYVILD